MASKKEKTNNTTSIRLDPELRGKLEDLARRMGAAAGGVDLPLSLAMRAALERGMASLDAELGTKSKARR